MSRAVVCDIDPDQGIKKRTEYEWRSTWHQIVPLFEDNVLVYDRLKNKAAWVRYSVSGQHTEKNYLGWNSWDIIRRIDITNDKEINIILYNRDDGNLKISKTDNFPNSRNFITIKGYPNWGNSWDIIASWRDSPLQFCFFMIELMES